MPKSFLVWRWAPSWQRFLFGVGLGLAVCLPAVALRDEPQDADKLLIVDCQLPGTVRRLGTSFTYLSARRPVKTSAQDCELRGGEYVAYDRSSYSTALNVWLPMAREGDKSAQTFVGEIYEKGLGATPDYAAAADWYRKAADQGYARAQINLGFLYEKGLGVKKDAAAALNLYRQAAGMSGGVALDDGAAAAAGNAQIEALRRELEETRRQLDKARQALDQQKGSSGSELQQLEEQRRKAEQAGNSAEVQRLATLLAQRETELRQRSQDIIHLERQMELQRAQLQGFQGNAAALRAELEQTQQRLAQSQKELEQRRGLLSEAQQALDSTRADIDRQKKQASTAEQSETMRLEALLKDREEQLRQQKQQLAEAERKSQQYQDQATQLQQASASRTAADPVAEIAAPSIQLIDPPVVLTRGKAQIKVQGKVASREVVGKITAPAGLLSFLVNDRSYAEVVDGRGLFRIPIAMAGDLTPVSIVAVDKQGKRAALDFVLVSDALATSVAAPVAKKLPPIDFGTYHALVIGNEKYQSLRPLQTAAADANSVADLLSRKYGFKTTTLLNATRYQLLSELNKLRAKLTDKDNLLIYYAGHGELDKTNLRGHWLPVDAEANSDANWISSSTITDILNSMAVKQVLVVADSCYSGALTRSSLGSLEAGMSDEARFTWLKTIAKKRVRTALTSGGLQPVLDEGGGGHSVFAKSFLSVLEANQEAMEGQRLYRELSARVLNDALRYRLEQVPEYAPIKFAGHESGDFLFVPVAVN